MKREKPAQWPPRQTMTGSIAQALGLRTKKPLTVKDTPAAARARAAGDTKRADQIMAEVEEVFEVTTAAETEREREEMFGYSPPMKEGEFRKVEVRRPPPGRAVPEGWEDDAPEREPFTSGGKDADAVRRESAAALAADYHAHTAKLREMADDARGNPQREARVAKELHESAALGEHLKREGIL